MVAPDTAERWKQFVDQHRDKLPPAVQRYIEALEDRVEADVKAIRMICADAEMESTQRRAWQEAVKKLRGEKQHRETAKKVGKIFRLYLAIFTREDGIARRKFLK